MGSFIHWLCDSSWIGARYKMGKTFQTGWSMRGITRSRAHHDSPDPTPLGPAGTPVVPALTHSTSGTVTGSNVRLGTSKDLSAGHETRLQRFATATIIRIRVLPASAQITSAAHIRISNIIIWSRAIS